MGADAAESTSLTLLGRVQRQEARSWQRLVEVYGPVVYRWCRRWGVPASQAEDVVQDVFCRVAKGIGTFEAARGSSFRGWLWRVARNAASDDFSRRQQQIAAAGGTTQHLVLQQLPDRNAADGQGDFAADVPLLQDDRSRLLHAVLETIRGDFQPQTWAIFWRSVMQGEETGVLSAELQMTPRAIRQARHRVMQRLRQEFQESLQ